MRRRPAGLLASAGEALPSAQHYMRRAQSTPRDTEFFGRILPQEAFRLSSEKRGLPRPAYYILVPQPPHLEAA